MNAALDLLSRSELTWRVGVTLAHTLWQGLAVAVLLAVSLRALRTASAGTRHAVACGALLMLLVASVVTFLRLGHAMPPIKEATWSGSTAEILPGRPKGSSTSASSVQADDVRLAASVGTTAKPQESAIPWHAWTVAWWMAGMMALTIWHGVGWIQLQRLRRRNVIPWADDFAALAPRIAKRLRLKFMPRMFWSGRIRGPVAFGCWRPVVLMPASMATGFTMDQIEMILAHEFAHLRRHDYLVNLCQTAAATLLFFNPALWWINHVIRREREHACDDLAVAAVGDPAGYARALVSLAEQEFFTGAPSLAPAALAGKGTLRRRIERLLHPLPSRPGLRVGPAIFVLLLVAMSWQVLPTQPPIAMAAAAGPDDALLRGDIRDRNGVVLATNDRKDVQIWFRLKDVAMAYAEAHGGTFPRTKRQPDAASSRAEDREVPDIAMMFHELVIPKLNAANLPQPAVDVVQPYNSTGLRRSYEGEEGLPAEVAPGQAATVLAKYGSELWCYRKGLTPDEEKRAREIAERVPGMIVRVENLRRYPLGALAGHLLGYVSKPLTSVYETGVVGVEKSQDAVLRPALGGNNEGPRRGADVYLTLDARHQAVVEQALRDARVGRGTAVLLEVNSGDVLAMASVPSYDPNTFIPVLSKDVFTVMKDDKTGPLVNRAITVNYPGNTFTFVTALSALCIGHGNEKYECAGSIYYNDREFMCWTTKGHGLQEMRQALANNCNAYFYQLGNAMGLDAMENTARLCGFGSKTQIGLEEEAQGFFPSREWREKRNLSPATAADLANLSVGHGRIQTTPLQMVRAAALVANGGTVWKPRLVDRITPAGDFTKSETQPRVRMVDLREHGLTDEGLATLRQAMEDVVHSNIRGARARSAIVRIAGSSGAAQNVQWTDSSVFETDAWFACYAPMDAPRWALVVVAENGLSGGAIAAPIARRILEQVSAIEAGTLKVEPKAMEPAKGHFNQMQRPFEGQ